MHPHPPRHRRRLSALAVGGFAIALTLASTAPAVADPTVEAVSLSAAPSAEIGDTVLVAVDLTGTTDVFTYEVTLDYDPAVLTYLADSETGPDGGFTAVAQGTGSLTLVHSRLGTSPALAGDLAATVSFTAVGSGSAAVRATSLTLVDAAGGNLSQTPTASTTTEVAAVVVPTPTPTPSASPSPTSSATAAPTTDPTSTPPSTTSPTTAPTTAGGGSLATTGVTVGTVLLVAAAAIGAGALLVRRRSAGTR